MTLKIRNVDGIDPHRLGAIERLSQVESRSDNLDDLIAQSSTTFEENRDAALALIHLFERVDADHLKDLRTRCKPAEPPQTAQPAPVAVPAFMPDAEAPAPLTAPTLKASPEAGPAPRSEAA